MSKLDSNWIAVAQVYATLAQARVNLVKDSQMYPDSKRMLDQGREWAEKAIAALQQAGVAP